MICARPICGSITNVEIQDLEFGFAQNLLFYTERFHFLVSSCFGLQILSCCECHLRAVTVETALLEAENRFQTSQKTTIELSRQEPLARSFIHGPLLKRSSSSHVSMLKRLGIGVSGKHVLSGIVRQCVPRNPVAWRRFWWASEAHKYNFLFSPQSGQGTPCSRLPGLFSVDLEGFPFFTFSYHPLPSFHFQSWSFTKHPALHSSAQLCLGRAVDPEEGPFAPNPEPPDGQKVQGAQQVPPEKLIRTDQIDWKYII